MAALLLLLLVFCFYLASTGIAACNIGGCTLHSFAGCGLGNGTDQQLLAKVASHPQSRNRWIATKVLIIDESIVILISFHDRRPFFEQIGLCRSQYT
jgi:hypothetical protein